MNLVASLIKLMFGTKSEKDRKLIAPYVEKILAIYPSIEQLSNDELRARSAALKAAVADHIREDEQQIADLKANWRTSILRSKTRNAFRSRSTR